MLLVKKILAKATHKVLIFLEIKRKTVYEQTVILSKDLNFKKCATNGMESKAISYSLPYLHVLDV